MTLKIKNNIIFITYNIIVKLVNYVYEKGLIQILYIGNQPIVIYYAVDFEIMSY